MPEELSPFSEEVQEVPVRVASSPRRRRTSVRRRSVRKYRPLFEEERPYRQEPSLITASPLNPWRTMRHLALGFAAASLVLLGTLMYFSLTEANIVIHSKRFPITETFSLKVKKGAAAEGDTIPGIILSKTVQATRTFPTSTQKVSAEKAYGIVTLVNTFSKDQALVATTRLLSEQGILFRIQNSVVVPSRSKVDVAVKADKDGMEGIIPPSHFTIPGLWAGLQDKIYGESREAMKGGVRDVKVLTEDDIKTARRTLEEMLTAQAKVALDAQAGAIPLTIAEIKKAESDTKIGKEVGTFDYSMTVTLVGVMFDKTAMLGAVRNKLASTIMPESHRSLAGVNEESLTYALEQYDVQKNTALIKVFGEGETMLAATSPALAKEKLVGLPKRAALTALQSDEAVERVEVSVYPFWQSSLPLDANAITLEIK